MKWYKSFIAFALSLSAVASLAQVSQPVGPGGRPQTFTNHGVLIGKSTSNVVATTAGTSGQCLISGGAGADPNWGSCSAGAGTVTSVSMVNANGFNGSVANATTTPAITVSTTVTGVLKGNGTAISAATSGTDYSAGTAGLATGILKSTTTTGALSIAVAGDFPTLNQNTTGTAANVTGTVAVANGGTGLTATPSNGQIDIGNGSGFTRATITAGSGISVTNGAGSIQISSTAGAQQFVLLDTITTAAAANADSLNSFTASYDSYKVVWQGVTLASGTDSLQVQFAVSGSADTASNYISSSGSTTATSITLCSSQSTGLGGATGQLDVSNTNASTGANGLKAGFYSCATENSSGNWQLGNGTVAYKGGKITGVRFKWSGGENFTAGQKIYIYGLKNS